MAPPGGRPGLQHAVRRAHPLRPLVRRELARLERAPAGELERYQERRLRALVRWAAARSPFYRRWFAGSGTDPASIRGLADLDRLPLVDRRQLAERPEDFLAYPRAAVWPARSSGTSGRPVTAYRTVGSSVYELAALERQWSWFGLPRGARRVVLRGTDVRAGDPGVVTRELRGANQLLVSSFHLVPASVPAILQAVRAFRPDAVEGWPSSIALLAALLAEAGERLPVRAVITSSEVMTARQRALMRQVFAGPVVDHYGQTERVVLAGDCEAGGYHVFSDYGIAELVPAPSGRHEVVGTALHNWGAPLLRYRTGDEVGPAPAAPCPCGRAFPRLGAVDGRVEDVFTASDGRPIPLPGTLVDDLPGVREAQVVQRSAGRFEVRVVPGAAFDAAATRAHARRNVDRLVGPGQEVVFRTLDRLPRTAGGKLRTALLLAEDE